MPARQSPQQRTADRLHSAAIRYLRRVGREEEVAGLGPARLSALAAVEAGPVSLGELAAAERVRPPTMSGIVAGLEADGLVRRAPSSSDGRVTLIAPTAKGLRALERARARRLALVRQGVARLSRADLAALERAAEIMEEIAATE